MRRCSEEYPFTVSTEWDVGLAVDNAAEDPFHGCGCNKRVRRCSSRLQYGVYFGFFVASSSILFLLYTFTMSRLGYYDIVIRGPRPQYLRESITDPVVIRLAIMSRASDFNRRHLLRDTMLKGIRPAYARVEYRFFIGKPVGGSNDTILQDRVARESLEHGDLEILDIEDTWNTISQKRFSAIRWTALVSSSEYDYSMTLDSDSFCRFQTLAQRLRRMFPHANPKLEPVIIGNMGQQSIYWENTYADTKTTGEDKWISGPRYSYPVGIGYMLSSHLAASIVSADPPVPHHIHYPWDDVMIGSWIAGLKHLHNQSEIFGEIIEGVTQKITPRPYLPNPVDSRIIDDKIGWHDFKNRGAVSRQRSIGWDTACVHRIKDNEVRKLRAMKEFEIEWSLI